MVKNNQFRHNLPELYIKARQSDKIILNWHNYNPSPQSGSWFTNKDKVLGWCKQRFNAHLLSWVQIFKQVIMN